MSVVFKCDRCGEIFNRKVPDINECYGMANSILFLDCTVERNRFGLGEEPIQLCPSCMKQLNDWLTPEEQKPDTGNKNEWNSIRYIAKGRNVLAASAVLWPVGGADSVSLCAGLPTRKCTSQRLKECSMPAKRKACRATGRPAWTFSAGGWKMTTSAVS